MANNLSYSIYWSSKCIWKVFAKKGTMLSNYFGEDSVFHPFMYLLGGFFTLAYTLDATVSGFTGPEWIVDSSTGGAVVPAIVMGVAWNR